MAFCAEYLWCVCQRPSVWPNSCTNVCQPKPCGAGLLGAGVASIVEDAIIMNPVSVDVTGNLAVPSNDEYEPTT